MLWIGSRLDYDSFKRLWRRKIIKIILENNIVIDGSLVDYSNEVIEQVSIAIKYEGYINRQERAIEKTRKQNALWSGCIITSRSVQSAIKLHIKHTKNKKDLAVKKLMI